MTRRAKIVCTLGPASEDRATITELANAGMSVARLNASHGTTAQRRRIVSLIREIDAETDRPIAVLHDLPGPEIRTSGVDDPIELREGDSVEFAPGNESSAERVGLTRSLGAASPGDAVLLDDGRIETTVTAVDGDVVTVRVDW